MKVQTLITKSTDTNLRVFFIIILLHFFLEILTTFVKLLIRIYKDYKLATEITPLLTLLGVPDDYFCRLRVVSLFFSGSTSFFYPQLKLIIAPTSVRMYRYSNNGHVMTILLFCLSNYCLFIIRTSSTMIVLLRRVKLLFYGHNKIEFLPVKKLN